MVKKNKKKAKSDGPATKTITENRRARHEYEILETIECGIVLGGSEVKSMRNGRVSLDEAYGRIQNHELYLVGCDIAEYKQANIWNHDPKSRRKLLVHKRQLIKLIAKAREKGFTLVPLKLYFNERGIAKLLLGVGRGKQLHDKRDSKKKADNKREIQREMKRYKARTT